ncbi:RNA polymerase sigma-70 factor, ECF subfamily [Nannocystis exedens]|uniref:RNA polymerase sigma-70 factor, ECF subfamily n=2 Tax=Nannocystis exedens TaxID=54 RepID=A0A1I2IK54_9BACT|nr:sigma-70 family RNA polymerase sigma factor [Nannocystis exedens]PCC72535.1 RNA polymerase sigma factor CnrH [Nannocystis exedens]SFF42023.1 RNA polymerase sigma-70 factor, ECF subfamily [Nannocystis exedens]
MTDRKPGGQSPHDMPPLAARSGPSSGVAPEFAVVFREHHDFVWRILRYFGVPAEAVDDKVQDVFLVVYRRWDDFDRRSSMRSWLYGIARRVAADLRRGTMRAERRLRAVPDPSPAVEPDQALAQIEAAEFVERFLATLDDDKREVFVLAELEFLTAPEIAAATGANTNTVYSRLRAARALFDRAVRRFAPELRRTHGQPR